jgi:diacylglycerol kinase family enzyme
MRTRLDILSLLPRTMKPGISSYVEHPSIHEVHATWLRIHCDRPTPLHADGEIQSVAVQDIEYRLLPAMLPVLVP